MHTIPYPVFCGFVLLAYFLPTITAFVREHRRLGWICLANILVGWTVLGWALVALWAMSSRRHHHPTPYESDTASLRQIKTPQSHRPTPNFADPPR
ncbi:MAG: superinfection immunity protein [Planctomycetes bacterium]|nr:superinfection immunity protein [Planctomycetota bacterium]